MERFSNPWSKRSLTYPRNIRGVVIEKLAKRKGEMKGMHSLGSGNMRLEYEIPTRGLIGFRSDFLTDTRGLGILAARFIGYGLLAR